MTIGSYIKNGGTVMYKTILVHIDGTARSAQRAELASRLAVLYAAHLVGAAMTGLRSYLLPVGEYGVGFDAPGLAVAQVRADANRALDLFESCARGAGVASVERRCIDEEPGMGISMQARYCDLVVISQSAPGEFLPRLRSDFPDYVVLNSPRPVLVLPAQGGADTLGQRITVAWNGSPEAARAVASAIPMLQRAQQVDLVVFDPATEGAIHGEDPGADIALYLARHGIRVEVSTSDAGVDGGHALLSFAQKKSSDLIVMGAYGHTRLIERILGGATRGLMESTPAPVLMSH